MAFKKNGKANSLGVVEIPDKTASAQTEIEKAAPIKPAVQTQEVKSN